MHRVHHDSAECVYCALCLSKLSWLLVWSSVPLRINVLHHQVSLDVTGCPCGPTNSLLGLPAWVSQAAVRIFLDMVRPQSSIVHSVGYIGVIAVIQAKTVQSEQRVQNRCLLL